MNKIYLFALLVAVASANLAADVGSLFAPRQTMTCLRGLNVTKVFFEIFDGQGAINKNFLSNYIYAKDVGIATVDATVVVNDNFTSSWFSGAVAAALPSNFNGTVWLQVESSAIYWNQAIDKRIPYLEGLVIAFQQKGVKVGIYSTANTWITVFGSQGAGSDTLKNASVWYSNDNGNENFDDFDYAGFGTWTKPNLKNYQSSVYRCYTMLDLNYYETEAQLKKINI